jgi:hypothetical protein
LIEEIEMVASPIVPCFSYNVKCDGIEYIVLARNPVEAILQILNKVFALGE